MFFVEVSLLPPLLRCPPLFRSTNPPRILRGPSFGSIPSPRTNGMQTQSAGFRWLLSGLPATPTLFFGLAHGGCALRTGTLALRTSACTQTKRWCLYCCCASPSPENCDQGAQESENAGGRNGEAAIAARVCTPPRFAPRAPLFTSCARPRRGSRARCSSAPSPAWPSPWRSRGPRRPAARAPAPARRRRPSARRRPP